MQIGEIELFWCCEETPDLSIYIGNYDACADITREQAREFAKALLQFADTGKLE